jgi:D-alanyl-D-alanine carboxypeptidase/D-alanyl-D-alanine-endopeptidase (penicillin-binding protein 4)
MDSSSSFNQASWGFCLLNGQTGKPISQFRAEKSLVPASVQKIFTTASALALLGDTFHFYTKLLVENNLGKEGLLKGDIVVEGGGNPILGSMKGSGEEYKSVIQTFAQQLKNKGVKEVDGSLIADVSYFEQEPIPSSWTWFDMGNYYAPEISALNLAENQYELYFKPGKKEGDSTQFLYTKPFIPGLTVYNHTLTAKGGGDQTYIPGPPREMQKHIYGKMPIGDSFKVKGAIPQPELFFLSLLKDEMSRIGIRTDNASPCIKRKGMPLCPIAPKPAFIKLYSHSSPSLFDICQYANQTSNNISSECLLRTLGAEIGKEGSTSEGIEVLKIFLSSRIKNIHSLKITDGSGMSKYNLCSPLQMAQFLSSIQKERWHARFVSTLPVSGKEGTLERICDGTKAEGKVFAKSGSMERIKCYAGYVKGNKGSLNPFAIFVNNHDVPNGEIVKWIEGLLEICVE